MGLVKTVIQPPFDIDAQRFIYATGLTRFEDKRAVNYLVKGLKQNGLWTKMIAVYPMVGGTAFSCKLNLVTPRDNDAAFRLTINNSPVISRTGIKWNGTTTYADTHLIPNTSLSLNDTHISYYSRSGVTGLNMGVTQTGSDRLYMVIAATATVVVNQSVSTDQFANSPTTGLLIANRISSNALTGYMNGAATIYSSASASVALSALPVYLGARGISPGNNPSNFSDSECAFASLGKGFTAAQAFVFYNIVQQFQTILNRAVN